MTDDREQTRYTEADILFATQSSSKVEANKRTAEDIGRNINRIVTFSTSDPETFEVESESNRVDEVAWAKTESLRRNLLFNPEKRTLILAFDVVTILAESPEDFETGNGEDLKRLLRQIDFSDDVDTVTLWNNILETLETERIRMLERCTNGAFCIEWHIGFALNSSDQTVANRGALVLRATFTALDPQIVVQAFTLPEELDEKRKSGERPTRQDLNGVQAFAIGPRLPFVKLIPEYADLDELKAYNQGFPEEAAVLTPEQFLSLVRDCALTPYMALELLAGSESSSPIEDPLEKDLVKFQIL